MKLIYQTRHKSGIILIYVTKHALCIQKKKIANVQKILSLRKKKPEKRFLIRSKAQKIFIKNLKQVNPDFRVFDSYEDTYKGGEMHG